MNNAYKILATLIITFSFNFSNSQIGPSLQEEDNTIKTNHLNKQQLIGDAHSYGTSLECKHTLFHTKMFKDAHFLETPNTILPQTESLNLEEHSALSSLKRISGGKLKSTLYLMKIAIYYV